MTNVPLLNVTCGKLETGFQMYGRERSGAIFTTSLQIYFFTYLAATGLSRGTCDVPSSLWRVGSHSLTRDWTQDPVLRAWVLSHLDHQSSPSSQLLLRNFFVSFFFVCLFPLFIKWIFLSVSCVPGIIRGAKVSIILFIFELINVNMLPSTPKLYWAITDM